jgi:bisphosphoglycerate-dependent phosphoglycerate mutase
MAAPFNLKDHGIAVTEIRALVKYVDGISDADIPELEIPTGYLLFTS